MEEGEKTDESDSESSESSKDENDISSPFKKRPLSKSKRESMAKKAKTIASISPQ